MRKHLQLIIYFVLALCLTAGAGVQCVFADERQPVKYDPDSITYYSLDEDSHSAAILAESQGVNILICIGTEPGDLEDILNSADVWEIDCLVLASDDGQEPVLAMLADQFRLYHLYCVGDQASLDLAASYGMYIDFYEYFTFGSKKVLLYPDEHNCLGVLIYDEYGAVFIADAMMDMSCLEGHAELGYLDLLSISPLTGTDADVIAMMDPKNLVITGSLPDDRQLSALYNTYAHTHRNTYMATEGRSLRINTKNGVSSSARTTSVRIKDSLTVDREQAEQAVREAQEQAHQYLKQLLKEEAEGQEEQEDAQEDVQAGAGNEDSGADSDDSNAGYDGGAGGSDGRKTDLEIAAEILNGKWDNGDERYRLLKEAGYDPDLVQAIADEWYNDKAVWYQVITFDMNGHGENIQRMENMDEPAILPDEPAADGCLFTGWFLDADCTEPYDAQAPVTSDFTLYAGWEED